ncbi:MAG: response regulator [Chloroflexota bacterium]
MMTMTLPKIEPKTKTILVIEDSDELRMDVIEMLNLEGYITAGADNGLTGVEQARKVNPDLILCDIMMPYLTGYEVLKTLRADANTASIPFIFLTAKTEHVDRRQGMVLGADDFLTKPFVAKELLDSIGIQLQKREEQLTAVHRRIDDITKSIARALPHEFRTPLNTVLGFSEMLQSEAQNLKPDQVAGWATHINQAGERLYRLVENYLMFVQLKTLLENEAELEPATASESINITIQSQASAVAKTHKRPDDLIMDVDGKAIVSVTDKYVQKIVEEIVDNAFKFSKKGQAVTVKGYLEDEQYTLQVSDEGRGMSSDQITEINAFMQFEREHFEQQGLGLGLALVRQIAELHNLYSEIKGDKETGMTVTVKFSTK